MLVDCLCYQVEYRPPARAVGAPANLQELMNNLPQRLPPGMTVPLPQMNGNEEGLDELNSQDFIFSAKGGANSSTAARNARKRANRAAAKAAAKEKEEEEQREKEEEEEKKAKAVEEEAHSDEGKQRRGDCAPGSDGFGYFTEFQITLDCL